jgi:hypothetical protein
LPVRLVATRLLEDVDRPRGEGVIGLEELTAVGRRRDDEDRRRAVSHDVFGDGEPAHHREHHVERDDVRSQRAAEFDGALAVLRLADDLDLGIGAEHLREPPANGQ